MPYDSFVLGPAVPVTRIIDTRPVHSLATSATWVVSPITTNETNGGFTKNKIDIFEQGDRLRRKAFGVNLPLLYPNAVQDDYIPEP